MVKTREGDRDARRKAVLTAKARQEDRRRMMEQQGVCVCVIICIYASSAYSICTGIFKATLDTSGELFIGVNY
jgi:hypothetical protein